MKKLYKIKREVMKKLYKIKGYIYNLESKIATLHNYNCIKYRLNPELPLNITTYNMGKNQPNHPSIKYFSKGWNGYKYWMAYTPYPNNDSTAENPCITYSNDGINWSEEGILNPIEDTPRENGTNVGYNSDVQLVMVNNVLECWWRTYYTSGKSSNKEVIYRKKSKDGIIWQDKEELFYIDSITADMAISPVTIYDEGKYKIWIMYKRKVLKYYESNDGYDWKYVRDIIVDVKNNFKVWHFDIIKNNDIYEFVGCYQYKGRFDLNNFIYYATSSDNIAYTTPIKILANGYKGRFDDLEIYRPSLCIDDKGYMLYYGAQKHIRIWNIGLIRFNNIKELSDQFIK